jgi:hypothetical protein
MGYKRAMISIEDGQSLEPKALITNTAQFDTFCHAKCENYEDKHIISTAVAVDGLGKKSRATNFR